MGASRRVGNPLGVCCPCVETAAERRPQHEGVGGYLYSFSLPCRSVYSAATNSV